jgi:hypothetical protein
MNIAAIKKHGLKSSFETLAVDMVALGVDTWSCGEVENVLAEIGTDRGSNGCIAQKRVKTFKDTLPAEHDLHGTVPKNQYQHTSWAVTIKVFWVNPMMSVVGLCQ